MTQVRIDAGLEEQLRACKERHLEIALSHRGDHIALGHLRYRIRWWVIFALSMILTDIGGAARSIVLHPNSWAAKVAGVGLMPGMLLAWMTVATCFLLPYIACAIFRPAASWRRASMGLASTGLGMGAFGFGVMAFVVSRFEAPQATSQWVISAVWCVVGMLMLTGAVNNEQNVRRACGENTPCD